MTQNDIITLLCIYANHRNCPLSVDAYWESHSRLTDEGLIDDGRITDKGEAYVRALISVPTIETRTVEFVLYEPPAGVVSVTSDEGTFINDAKKGEFGQVLHIGSVQAKS